MWRRLNALAALGWEDAPLAGRLALLLRGMKPSELQSALLRLRFSTRDAVLAARYGAALRHFATGHRRLPLKRCSWAAMR